MLYLANFSYFQEPFVIVGDYEQNCYYVEVIVAAQDKGL